MVLFRRIALLTTASVYFLIFVGGLVRVSGAGLGCPDWPRCFGRWIPPVNITQLPTDIDPAQFNFTLAWIEYVNRLIGVGVGLLVAFLAVLALWRLRHLPAILWPTVAAALLTAFQGWQGSVVVSSELEPIVVSVHMLTAFVIASLLIWVTYRAHAQAAAPERSEPAGRRLSLWFLLLWIVTLSQVVFGTQVREALEVTERALPLQSDAQLLAAIGTTGLYHSLAGTVLAILLCAAGFAVLARRRHVSALAVQAAWALIPLGLLQVAAGAAVWSVGIHPVLQVMHLWLATLTAGVVLVGFLDLRSGAPATEARGNQRPRLLGIVVAALVLLGLLAAVVTNRAEFSRRRLPLLGALPPFCLVAQDGSPWGLDQLQGKTSLVYFGFASCRGPCPIVNAHLSELYELYDGSDRVQIVFVSVDPERDSLAALSALAASLGVTDDRWVFLRAPLEDVVTLCEGGFMMAADNLPGGHSTKVVLVDNEAQIRGYYDGLDDDAYSSLRSHIRQLARGET